MAKTELDPTAEALLVLGDAGSGKTQLLVERARRLVADGVPEGDVAVFCAAPQASGVMRRRLAGAGLSGVHVSTPRELALSVLASEDARAFTGRGGRMLLPFEEDFLFEDVGTSGIKRRREKEMLKFFARNFSEMADEDEWLLEGEETYLLGLLRECLGTTGGMLECEVAGFAVRWLSHSAGALSGVCAEHVLADDYQLYSRASQLLVNLVARRSIAVAVDPHVTEAVFDSYPYAQGPREFAQANPNAEVVRLTIGRRSQVAAAMTGALLADSGMAGDDVFSDLVERAGRAGGGRVDVGSSSDSGGPANSGVFEEREFPSPEVELRGIAGIVSEAVRAGVDSRDICVVHPGGRWGREVARVLPKLGIATAEVERGSFIRGDVRDRLSSTGAQMLSLLALLAHDDDAVALRSLCGFGDGLAGSFGFAALREYAGRHGMSFPAVLDAAARGAGGLPESVPDQAAGAVSASARFLEAADRCRGFDGHALVDVLAAEVARMSGRKREPLAAGLSCLAGPVSDGDDARALFERAYGRLCVPDLTSADAVRVLDMRDLVGQDPRLIVLTGFVNGIVPPRVFFDKSALLEKELAALWSEGAHRVYATVGKAGERLVVTRFVRISPEGAESLELEVDRVRFENGRRVCVVGAGEYVKLVRDAEGARVGDEPVG